MNEMSARAYSGLVKLIGMRILQRTPDLVEGEIEVSPDLANMANNMHGGAIMAFADTLGGMGAHGNLPPGATTTTLESKTNFFAAIPVGDKARGESVPLHKGRTTQVWQTRIFRGDGRLAAMVTQTQIVLPAAPRTTAP